MASHRHYKNVISLIIQARLESVVVLIELISRSAATRKTTQPERLNVEIEMYADTAQGRINIQSTSYILSTILRPV